MARDQEMFESEGSSDEQSLLSDQEAREKTRTFHARAAAIGLFCLAAACMAAVATASIGPPQHLRSKAQVAEPLTAHSLLVGRQLTDMVTDNVMTVGEGVLPPNSRDKVRASVARQLQNFSDTIKVHYPEDHRKLQTIQLSEAQKTAVLGALKPFGDKRMVAVANAMSDAVHEAKAANEDKESLKRRLIEKLAPHFSNLKAIAQEQHPGMEFSLVIGDDTEIVKKYERHTAKAPAAPAVASSRRLQGMEDFSGGVAPQMEAVVGKLHEQVAGMPEAPARVLQDTTGQSDSEQSFISCMMENMSSMNVTGVIGCVFHNLREAVGMVTDMMTGGGSSSSR